MDAISAMRKVYKLNSLHESDVDDSPVREFEKWWHEAVTAKVDEPNAMTLTTVGANGQPSARIVLLKEVKDNGFVFFTNYCSRKAIDLARNPLAALLFFWRELERQIRIEGSVKKVSEEESDQYFATRPRESQIGAWSSPQSSVIENETVLAQNVRKYSQSFEGKNVPRPPHWGGFILIPDKIEFWQGRPGRLHDRVLYSRLEGDAWKIERLAP